LRARYPRIPLVVEVPPDVDDDLRELLDGTSQVTAPATREQIVATVQSVLGTVIDEVADGA
jgi:hypothetical protein